MEYWFAGGIFWFIHKVYCIKLMTISVQDDKNVYIVILTQLLYGYVGIFIGTYIYQWHFPALD